MPAPPPPFLTEDGSISSVSEREARSVELYDTTLRDGEQQAGVAFSKDDKIRIFRRLEAAGVPYIETGMLPVHRDEPAVVRSLRAEGADSEIFVLCRSAEEDIRAAAEAGAHGATVEITVNPVLAEAVFGWSSDVLIAKATEAVTLARDLGLRVNMFGLDATRTPIEFLVEFFQRVAATGAIEWVTIADTLGVASPGDMRRFCEDLTAALDVQLQVHCHNDYGVATANSIASVEAGASVIQGTMNGLGERAGNANLAEVALAGRFMKGWDVGVKVQDLREAAIEVSACSGIPMAWNQPGLGPRLFEIESGIGAAFYERLREGDLRYMYPYLPSAVDAEPTIALGKKAGIANIRMRLAAIGISDVADDRLGELVARVKDAGVELKRTLDESEWESIVEDVLRMSRA
jgi:isopropylmalate/homocitrate/citramalate synthase